MENNKTPSIRFKGFTAPWEQRKFGDTCKINGRIGFRGYTEKDIISKEAGGVLTFSPTNIVENKLTMECKNTYITRDKYEESPEIMVKNGDILFVKTGSTLGKSALVTRLEEDASINPQIVVMRVKEGTEAFMSNILITQGILKQVAAVRIGGAVPTMTETELKNFEYFAPTSDKEKMQIGTIFADIDHLITLHQRKYNKLLNVKKSMLEKMFPKNGSNIPEIRFKGFTDPWEQRKAKNLFVSTADKGHPELPVLSATQDRGMIRRDENSINIYHDKKNEEGYKRVLPGQFVIHLRSFQGGFAHSAIEGITSPAYTVFGFSEPEKHNPNYWKYVFTSKEFIRRLETVTYGIRDGRSISYDEFLTMDFVYPTQDEQTKIANYLDTLDNLITLHQRELEKLQNIKKSMLEKMFV